MDKEKLQQQVDEMKVKLAEMEALLNKPSINYWQPEKMDKYFYVNQLGNIRYDCANDFEVSRYRIFKTEAEAQKYADYIKAEETLKKAIAEANEGWWPAWDGWEGKYVVGFVFKTKHISVLTYVDNKLFSNFMYIKSKELAEKLMKNYKAEFLTYLSY